MRILLALSGLEPVPVLSRDKSASNDRSSLISIIFFLGNSRVCFITLFHEPRFNKLFSCVSIGEG